VSQPHFFNNLVRLDRFITLNLVQPLRRASLDGRQFRLPILMYHSISQDLEENIAPYYRTVTSPDVFRQHMELLRSEGYQTVTLSTGVEMLKSSMGVPTVERIAKTNAACDKPIVLTFDDGFRDFYTTAFPILQRYGLSATVFLPTAFIGEEPRQFKSRNCMTWDEIRELHDMGIKFGSHTMTHPRLVDLDWVEIEKELRDSKSEIERRLSTPIRTFAYPYAFPQADTLFVGRLSRLLGHCGYECCVTTKVERARAIEYPFVLPRLPVNSWDDSQLLQAKLMGAYDWVGVPQDFVKYCRQWFETSRRIFFRRSSLAQPARS
jgi:peptidoglycan/xylan/chitin deacetylase (PgdA/CDA1 family)